MTKNPQSSLLHKTKPRSARLFSLLQDYYIYAGFILIVALVSSLYSAAKLYNSEIRALRDRLESQSQLIDARLGNYFNHVSHIAEDKGHKIALNGGDINQIAYLFKRNFFFSVTKTGLQQKAFLWPHFSWINKTGKILVKSEFGVLKQPQKAERTEHLYQSTVDNWRLHFSEPYYDSFKEKTFIDASLGVSNIETDEYIGTINTRFNIEKLVKTIIHDLKPNIKFIILNEDLKPIMNSDNSIIDDGKKHFVRKLYDIDIGKAFSVLKEPIKYGDDIYKIYRKSVNYPFIILTGYDSKIVGKELKANMAVKIAELFGAAFLILLVLLFQRQKIIKPINDLAMSAKRIAKGETNVDVESYLKDEKRNYPNEIYELGKGISLTKRLLDEERENKQSALENTKKLAEINSKLEQKNQLADKSKKSREKFISEIRQDIIEDAVLKMTKDIAQILNHEQGNVVLTKQAKVEMHKKMLDRCAKILSYVSDTLNLAYINVNKLMDEAVEVISHDAKIREVELICEISKKIPDIYVDQRGLKQVIVALISYCMEDRKRDNLDSFVKITAKNKKQNGEQYLNIIFEDNGHGVSEELRMNFQEAAKKQGKDNISAGSLSLYAIRYILTLHKGTLNIKSTPTKGSIVDVKIPYKTPETFNQNNQTTANNNKTNNKDNSNNKKDDLGKFNNVIELFPASKKD